MIIDIVIIVIVIFFDLIPLLMCFIDFIAFQTQPKFSVYLHFNTNYFIFLCYNFTTFAQCVLSILIFEILIFDNRCVSYLQRRRI